MTKIAFLIAVAVCLVQGQLVVTQGLCQCWFTPLYEVWAPCERCAGWFVSPDGESEIRLSPCMTGPDEPYAAPWCWQVDLDRDGDVDLHDLAYVARRQACEPWEQCRRLWWERN